MKKMKFIATIFLVSIGFSGYCQSDSSIIQFRKNLPIKDITETLSECNCIIMGMRGELNEKEKKLTSRGQALIFGREFKELDSLFNHGNSILQLYAFGGICLTYPDSIVEKHLTILNKEGEVNIYKQGAEEYPKQPISQIADQMYSVVARVKKEKEIQKIVEQKIQDFINVYSMFPKSYIPVKFKDFHIYSIHNSSTLSKVENSGSPSIEHIFKIKNKEGTLAEYSAQFKLDNELNMMLIEEEESGTFSCFPPELDWWIKKFGRKLSKKDKIELGINK
jgi:hypothetical protein